MPQKILKLCIEIMLDMSQMLVRNESPQLHSSCKSDAQSYAHAGQLGTKIPKHICHSVSATLPGESALTRHTNDIHVTPPLALDDHLMSPLRLRFDTRLAFAYTTVLCLAFFRTDLVEPEGNETATFSTDPRRRIVGTVHQSVLEEEGSAMGYEGVALHFSKSNTTGSFSTLRRRQKLSKSGPACSP